MRLYQIENGYCYNSDTAFLYDFISRFKPKGRVLDVGSGCGVLGLLLKRDFDIDLTQIELQKDVADINDINAKTNELSSKVINCDYIAFEDEKKFDFIVSNPPFYDAKSLQSPNKMKKHSRFDSSLSLDGFFKKTNSLISNKGYFIFCYRVSALSDIVKAACERKFNLEMLRYVHPKVDRPASLAMFCFKKSSRSSLVTAPPLIAHDDKGFSEEANGVFKKAGTHSIKCMIS